MTYNWKGAKQVAVAGTEEKCAFTLVVGVSASGDALPFQVVYKGKTSVSLPVKTATNSAVWAATQNLGFCFDFSGNDTYWSTLSTMKTYVNKIIAPYFDKACAELGFPIDQLEIWQIDAWSVHRSVEFHTWMVEHHSNIQLDFVPGSCTGLWQPCDVRIQRLIKHEIRRAARVDVIVETLNLLELEEATSSKSKSGISNVSAIILEKGIKTLQDQTVGWLVKSFNMINRTDFIQKVSAAIVHSSAFLLIYANYRHLNGVTLKNSRVLTFHMQV